MSTSHLFLSWLEPDRNGIAHGRIDPFDLSELNKLKAEAVLALSIGRDVALTLYSGRAARAITHDTRDKDRFVVIFMDSDDRLNGQIEDSFAEAIKHVRHAVSQSMRHSVMMLRESFLIMNDWPANSPRYLSRCRFEAGVSAEFERLVEDHYGTQLISKLAAFLCVDNDVDAPYLHTNKIFLGTARRTIRGFVKPDAVVSINIEFGDPATGEITATKDDAKSREESNRSRVIAARE